MVWTILQTVGSLLSGISILTAFVLYRIEKRDIYIKQVRQSIAEMRSTIAEQYSLIEANYFFSYVEEYFSNKYVQHYLNDLGTYVGDSLDKTNDEIKKYCRESQKWTPMLTFPMVHQSEMPIQFYENNKTITKSITYDLADIKGIAQFLKIFQSSTNDLDEAVKHGITTTDFGIDAICDVLIENRTYINNENIIRRKLIQKYISVFKQKYEKQVQVIKTISQIIDLLLEELFSYSDNELYHFIQISRKQTISPCENLHANLRNAIDSLPMKKSSDCINECNRKIGSVDSIIS